MSPYFAHHDPLNFFSFCVATDQFGHRPTSLLRFLDPTQWTSSERANRSSQGAPPTQHRNIHALRWIRSRDRCIQATADLHLRPHGHLDRSINIRHVFPRYITCPHLETHNISAPVINKLCAPLHSSAISDQILHDTVECPELILVINQLNVQILVL